MPAKKKAAKKTVTKKVTYGGVTTTTWILFAIFLVVSYLTIKTIFQAQELTASIAIPTAYQLPTKAATPSAKVAPVKTVKK